MFMYAKCTGSPWLLQIPAEDGEGKGKLRWEMGTGRSFIGRLFLTRGHMIKCCVILYIFLIYLVGGCTL